MRASISGKIRISVWKLIKHESIDKRISVASIMEEALLAWVKYIKKAEIAELKEKKETTKLAELEKVLEETQRELDTTRELRKRKKPELELFKEGE